MSPTDPGPIPTAGARPARLSGHDEQRLSAEEINAIQEDAWAQTVRNVWACSPFYREHFRRAGLASGQQLPLSELHRIPSIDKRILCENTDAFLCVPERRVVDIVTTSGSTGQPLVWKLTESDLERVALNELLSFTCAGFTPDDRVLLAVAMDRCFIAGMAYFLGLRKLGCAILRVGPAAPAMHLDLLRRTAPSAIVGVPSFLLLLADKAAENGIDVRQFGIRRLVCIGEPLRQSDLRLNPTGAALEQRFGARVFSTYGITELAASMCECEAGVGGHLHPELLYLEVLDEQDRPVPDGVIGEVTATTFGVEGMPLVRYRTGDCAAMDSGPCACGRCTPRLGPIVGRKDQKLKLKGTTIFPSALKAVLDGTPQVSAYVIIARKEGELSDSVEIKIACSGDTGRVCRALAERIQGEAKVTPTLTPAAAEEIERLQMPEGARKRRFFIDLRQASSS